jgi:hypothetical protein
MRAQAFDAYASPERIGVCGRKRFLDQRLHRRAAIRRLVGKEPGAVVAREIHEQSIPVRIVELPARRGAGTARGQRLCRGDRADGDPARAWLFFLPRRK